MRPKPPHKKPAVIVPQPPSDKRSVYIHTIHYSLTPSTQPKIVRQKSTPVPSRYLHRRQSSVMGLPSVHRRQTGLHLTQLQGMHDLIQPKEHIRNSPSTRMKQQFMKAIKALWSTELWKDGLFLPYVLNFILGSSCYYIPFAFIPDRAKSYGIPKTKAAFLLSVIGITSTASRLIFGAICDIPRVRKHRLYVWIISFVISGVSTALSFHKDYVAQVIYGVIFGIGTGK